MEPKFIITDGFPTEEEMRRLIEGSNPGDPANWAYKRDYKRPKINWLIVAANLVVPVLLTALLWFYLGNFEPESLIINLAPLFILLFYVLLRMKNIVLFFIKAYQRFAPVSIRKRCRFEPSCSEYMQISIGKYGFFKGLRKGISRLRRCNAKNGGFDLP